MLILVQQHVVVLIVVIVDRFMMTVHMNGGRMMDVIVIQTMLLNVVLVIINVLRLLAVGIVLGVRGLDIKNKVVLLVLQRNALDLVININKDYFGSLFFNVFYHV